MTEIVMKFAVTSEVIQLFGVLREVIVRHYTSKLLSRMTA